jgi:hypothetical protein
MNVMAKDLEFVRQASPQLPRSRHRLLASYLRLKLQKLFVEMVTLEDKHSLALWIPTDVSKFRSSPGYERTRIY